MEALNKQALRILHLFGNDDVKCVRTSVGAEQEYFLIDKEMYDKRPDLRFTGRTLFGAKAPPAVVSMFLGDELNAVLEAIENNTPYEGVTKTQMKLGVDVLPRFNRDTTDRNRTSPFAFTGNKFEFRMLGSSNSIACANIMLENYCKTVLIEANTMVDMAKTEIAPAVEAYTVDLAKAVMAKKAVDIGLACTYESALVKKLSTLTDRIAIKTEELENSLVELHRAEDIISEANMIRDVVLVRMSELRLACDEAETITAKKYWPFPTYGDLLFSVR